MWIVTESDEYETFIHEFDTELEAREYFYSKDNKFCMYETFLAEVKESLYKNW